MNKNSVFSWLVILVIVFATGCTPTAQPTPQDTSLAVSLLYPTETTEVEMGQSLKGIAKVVDEQGKVLEDAQLTLSFLDPAGEPVASIPATFGAGGVYRSEAWTVPHKMKAGTWSVRVEARAGAQQGEMTGTFQVIGSVSEMLLGKYGFWVNTPSLRGMTTTLANEQGDAKNGEISWGGTIPTQHIFPESWLEVQWREGKFKLGSAEDVRKFMTGTLGNPGIYPTRSLESFQQTRFKDWEAWQVKARGQLSRYDEQWMIFYAPEVDKTYALGTTVVQAPEGIDPHATLRDSFEVHPEVHANGEAPKPLLQLLPPPELISPELGATFFGNDQPIVLEWQPVKELAADEYYQVSIDYNYAEANPRTTYATRETQFVLPGEYYTIPNCSVFNWRITLMQQTGTDPTGQPEGVPLSFDSFYWYFRWFYPTGEEAPFNPLCPNQQF
jgi:hypothetical protein